MGPSGPNSAAKKLALDIALRVRLRILSLCGARSLRHFSSVTPAAAIRGNLGSKSDSDQCADDVILRSGPRQSSIGAGSSRPLDLHASVQNAETLQQALPRYT